MGKRKEIEMDKYTLCTEDFSLDNQELLLGGRTYPMDYGHDGGLEVIAGEPIKVDSENIGYWKDQI